MLASFLYSEVKIGNGKTNGMVLIRKKKNEKEKMIGH